MAREDPRATCYHRIVSGFGFPIHYLNADPSNGLNLSHLTRTHRGVSGAKGLAAFNKR